MAKKREDKVFTDALGNVHKHFADGRCEIYVGGCDKAERIIEVTDMTDASVNRKRFIEDRRPTSIEDTLQTRGDGPEESAVPGIDFDDDSESGDNGEDS